jgi:hypothetical protein
MFMELAGETEAFEFKRWVELARMYPYTTRIRD